LKAAIYYEFGKPLVIEDVTIDPPGKGEVKVRVGAAAICHSDIHLLRGEHGDIKLPAVFGHEVAGYVEEVGKGITYVKPGDHVVLTLPPVGCGKCFYCTIGFPQACETRPVVRPGRMRGFAGPGRYTNKKGQRLNQLSGPAMAGFVEYTIVTEDHLTIIPDEMAIDRAVLLSCGVISGVGAVVNRAQVKPFSSVIVVGAGGVGVNVIQGAVLSGANPIIAVDIFDSKLETARAFGATHTINAKKEKDPIEAAYKLTSGRGADFVFVAVAGIENLRTGFMMSGWHGLTVSIGHSGEENLASFSQMDFFAGERMLTGSTMGSIKPRVDIPRLVSLYQVGRLKLDELITGRYPLERINEAIESSSKGEALRNIIIF
jgi:S-(hydroxymethyl)glutathione dehydrogenase / alcohol dehydrogenase